jgi:hypothetical protein
MGAMVPVTMSGGATISCSSDGRYSFYNSPYPAHRLMTGIDIYTNTAEGEAPSPVDGEVLQVRRVKAPRGHGFKAPEEDVVTIIKCRDVPNRVVKIIHVDTQLNEGDKVTTGQTLGAMIRSGYFGYQTPLHAHVEVRPLDDPIRVRGGYPMNSLLDLDNLKITEELKGTIAAARSGYAQIKLDERAPWVVVSIDGKPAIIDGGIPIYGWFGAHTKNTAKGATIKLLGKNVGTVTDVGPRTCVAECTKPVIRIGSIPVDLFFVLLPKGGSMVVVTSRKRGELDLHEGDEEYLTVS